MGKVVPYILRKRIVKLYEGGNTAKQVSEELSLGYSVVAKICRLYREGGEKSLEIKYYRCGRKSPYGSIIREAIDGELSKNEEQGAPIIRSRLLSKGDYKQVPHERTIQRWWKASGKNKVRSFRPSEDNNYSKLPHETWQIDAKEQVKIKDGTQHCYLSFTDEGTCSFLKGYVFSLYPLDASSKSIASSTSSRNSPKYLGFTFENAF